MKKRSRFKSILAGFAIAAFFLILTDAAIVWRATGSYKRALPSIQAEIERNLAVLPKDTHWTPLFSWIPYPKLIGARCVGYLGGSRITVELTHSGRVKSADMFILDVLEPGTSRSDVERYGVKDKMLPNLTGGGGRWESQRGKYSLTIMDY